MRFYTTMFLAVSCLAVLACSKGDAVVGNWNGTEQMTPAEKAGLADMPADIQNKMAQTFQDTKGTLTLDAGGSASETNNFKGGHQWTGKWTRQGNKVTVALDGYETQDMNLSSDEKTLTYRGWTFVKQ